jgi:hypothetical protein
MPDWMADLTQRAGGDGSSAKEKAERDARWVGEFADELTVAIALREWDQAVSLVEEGRCMLNSFCDNYPIRQPFRQSQTFGDTSSRRKIDTVNRLIDWCSITLTRPSH